MIPMPSDIFLIMRIAKDSWEQNALRQKGVQILQVPTPAATKSLPPEALHGTTD